MIITVDMMMCELMSHRLSPAFSHFLGSTTERATEKGPRNIFDYFPYLYLSFPVPEREGYRETHQEECSGKNIILF